MVDDNVLLRLSEEVESHCCSKLELERKLRNKCCMNGDEWRKEGISLKVMPH